MSRHFTVITVLTIGFDRYFEIVKNPMDLGTMSMKLQQGQYKSLPDFEEDFRLMVQNCRTYNAAGTYVHDEANHLEAFFDKSS